MSLTNNILEKPTIQKTEWKSLMISNRDSNSDQLFAKNKIAKKPKWIRVKLPTGKKYAELRGLVDKYKLNTKNYGRLSIISNWKLNIKKITDIKPESFSPKPKIDSSLLLFTPKEKFFELKDAKNLEMITRILIVAVLVLSCSLCIADDFDTNDIKSLTAEQAAELVANFKGDWLDLSGLESIEKKTAKQLAKFRGKTLELFGLTSISKSVAHELSLFSGETLNLCGLTVLDQGTAKELVSFKGKNLTFCSLATIKKDVARELVKFNGAFMDLEGLTSIDHASIRILNSNKAISLPEMYR